MPLVELPDVRENRDGRGALFKVVNMVRRRVNEALGEPAALALASVAGFATAPVMHGAPVGVPDAVQEDRAPWVVDDINLRVWFYMAGAWHYIQAV